MASYRLLVRRSAAKEIERIDSKSDRQRVIAAIGMLANAPRPHGVEKLAGVRDGYRIRVGDFRIVYTIEDDALIVWIVKVGHRRELYRSRPITPSCRRTDKD